MVKILGYEIKRSQTNAENIAVKVVPSTQQTKPTVPLKKSFPREQLGDTGTRMSHGIISDDYNPNLQGVQAIKIYDEMRKGDGTVRAAMLVTTLPIRRAQWNVNSASEDQADIDAKTFVEHALFDWLSWDDIVRQALLMLPFGVMAFEKVYGVKDHEGKSYVTIDKLAPRLPKSIQQWELSDGTLGIQQLRQDGHVAQIPWSKLLVFINEQEGDNYWGTSMLRAAYKHWYHKDNFYKIDAIAFERQGLGVPMIKMPKGYTESDEQKAITAASNLRANENGFLILPPEYDAEFMNMGASSTRDPQNSINHHNKQILQSVLAQFLELGQTSTGGGSRALSEDHSDIFLAAMEAIADSIATVINRDLIPELVDMNFDGVTRYPKLAVSGITRVDVKALADAFKVLIDAKAVKPIEKDEAYLRGLLGLPELTQEDKDEREEQEQENIDKGMNPDGTPKVDPNADPKNNPEADTEDDPEEDTTKKDNKKVDNKVDNEKQKAHEHTKQVRKFSDGKGGMYWRKLTFAEQKVNFSAIEDKMNALQEKFKKDATDLLNTAKDAFVSKLQNAMEDDDTKAIADLEIKFVKDYKTLIKDYMREAYVYGKTIASGEIKVDTPANTASTLASIDLLADTIAWKAAIDIETKAKISVVNGMKKLSEQKTSKGFASIIQVVGAIDQVLEETATKIVNTAAGLIINQGMNMGRKDVFDKNIENVQSLQRSEILDEVTCDFCLSMDGRVIEPTDSWGAEDSFHDNCRGIWVGTMNDEVNPPEITGIPNNLGDYYGGEPNALIQPPKPIVRPDSPAMEEVTRRAEEKKKKKTA